MWTYLAIFLSISVIVLVFARKLFLFFKKDKPSEKKDSEKIEESSKIKKEKISRSDKSKVESLCSKGESLIKAGRDDEAIKCFVQALAIDSAHMETQHKLAMLYLQKQMYGAAAALFKRLGETSQDAVHYSHLGLALYQQSDYEEAKKAYQKAVDLDKSRPQRFVSLAQVYRALGQLSNAVIALNKALEIDEDNLNFIFLLADLQFELGNLKEAKEVLDRILELEPENKDAKELLKEITKAEKEKVESQKVKK